jgi:hypothetical protein
VLGVHPLHTLPVEELREVRNIHDLLLFGEDDGYCSETESLCERRMESGMPYTLVKDVMHGLL